MPNGLSREASKILARVLFGRRSGGRTTSSIIGESIESVARASGMELTPGRGEQIFHEALLMAVDPKGAIAIGVGRATVPTILGQVFERDPRRPARVQSIENLALARGRVRRNRKGQIIGFTPAVVALQRRRKKILAMRISPIEKKRRLSALRKVVRDMKKVK